MLERVVRFSCRVCAGLGGLVLMLVMLLTVLDFSLRFLVGTPIAGVFELTELAMVAIALLGLGQAQLDRQHITIDLVYEHLSGRGRLAVRRIASILCVALTAIATWQLCMYLVRSRTDAEVTSVLGIPVFPFVAVALLGFALYALALLAGRSEVSDVA